MCSSVYGANSLTLFLSLSHSLSLSLSPPLPPSLRPSLARSISDTHIHEHTHTTQHTHRHQHCSRVPDGTWSEDQQLVLHLNLGKCGAALVQEQRLLKAHEVNMYIYIEPLAHVTFDSGLDVKADCLKVEQGETSLSLSLSLSLFSSLSLSDSLSLSLYLIPDMLLTNSKGRGSTTSHAAEPAKRNSQRHHIWQLSASGWPECYDIFRRKNAGVGCSG